MKRVLITQAGLLVLTLFLSLSAAAAWNPFVTMGSTPVGPDPTCASATSQHATCAAIGLNHTLLVDQFNGTSWSGWISLGGSYVDSPSCTADGAGRVICAARGQSSTLFATVWNGTSWSTPISVGGQVTSAPSCAALASGHVLCSARNISGGLTSSVFNGSTWSSFATASAQTTTGPGCASDGAGNVICAAVSTTGTVLVNRFNGTSWASFIDIGGRTTSAVNCTPMDISGQVACFARGTDSSYWGNRFNGGIWSINQWGRWGTLLGLVNPGGSCAAYGVNEIVCGVVGITDSALWVNQFNGTGWLGFTRVGQTALGNPACTSLSLGKVLCAIVSVNGSSWSTVGP